MPRDAGDFRLVNRKVINQIVKIKDSQPYIRGAIAAMGFNQYGIEYNRDARVRGKSKFGFRKLISLGLDGTGKDGPVISGIALPSTSPINGCISFITLSIIFF